MKRTLGISLIAASVVVIAGAATGDLQKLIGMEEPLSERDIAIAEGKKAYNNNIPKAYRILLPYAEKKDPDAQAYVGLVLAREFFGINGRRGSAARGWGSMPRDKERGIAMLKTSAKEGSAAGKFHLGIYYRGGANKVPRNEARGWQLIDEAANLGHLPAQEQLFLFYFISADDLREKNERDKRISYFAKSYKWARLLYECTSGRHKLVWKARIEHEFHDHMVLSRARVVKLGENLVSQWKKKQGRACL
ncbi:MAG: hypothetical protein GKS01_15210 [Alphaproteobacteria bacterium]|nr:hypothetical protein [Alphaproteobacteria bacterium]